MNEGIAAQCVKEIDKPVPNTQHRSIQCKVKSVIRTHTITFKRRYNFKKANWKTFSEDLDEKVKNIAPVSTNYDLFIDTVKETSRRHIPRKQHISKITPEISKKLDKNTAKYENDPFGTTTIEEGIGSIRSYIGSEKKQMARNVGEHRHEA